MMQINETNSYTEYTTTEPTTDFVVGFEYFNNKSIDTVNITVDNADAVTAGYTVSKVNDSVFRLTPAVPSGSTVRLLRETDLDAPIHKFSEGALFRAPNVDANFKQILHAQQEVRDGFTKLSDDTYQIIDTLEQVAQDAQEAADAANSAAVDASNAAQAVGNKVDRREGAALPYNPTLEYAEGAVVVKDGKFRRKNGAAWVSIGGASTAAELMDASGKTQQEINDGLDSVLQMLLISNPLNGMRVYVKSFHAGLNQGGKYYTYDSSKANINDSGLVIRGWVAQGVKYLDPRDFGATANNTSLRLTDLYNAEQIERIYGTDIDLTKTIDTIALRKLFLAAKPTTVTSAAEAGGMEVISDRGVFRLNGLVVFDTSIKVDFGDSLVVKDSGYHGVLFACTYPFLIDWRGGKYLSIDTNSGALFFFGRADGSYFNVDQSKIGVKNISARWFRDIFAKVQSQSCLFTFKNWRLNNFKHILGRATTLDLNTGLYKTYNPLQFGTTDVVHGTPDTTIMSDGWYLGGSYFSEDLDAMIYCTSELKLTNIIGVPIQRTSGFDVAFVNTTREVVMEKVRVGGESGSFATLNYFGFGRGSALAEKRQGITISDCQLVGQNRIQGFSHKLVTPYVLNDASIFLDSVDGLPDEGIISFNGNNPIAYTSVDRVAKSVTLSHIAWINYAVGTPVYPISSQCVVRLIRGCPMFISFRDCNNAVEMSNLVGYSYASNLANVKTESKDSNIIVDGGRLAAFGSGKTILPPFMFDDVKGYTDYLTGFRNYGTVSLNSVATVEVVPNAQFRISLDTVMNLLVKYTESTGNTSLYSLKVVKVHNVSAGNITFATSCNPLYETTTSKITAITVPRVRGQFNNAFRSIPLNAAMDYLFGAALKVDFDVPASGSVDVLLAK